MHSEGGKLSSYLTQASLQIKPSGKSVQLVDLNNEKRKKHKRILIMKGEGEKYKIIQDFMTEVQTENTFPS